MQIYANHVDIVVLVANVDGAEITSMPDGHGGNWAIISRS